jgi:hypothetical protein
MDNIATPIASRIDATYRADVYRRIPGILSLLARMAAVNAEWPADEVLAIRRAVARATWIIEDEYEADPDEAASLIVSLLRCPEYENYHRIAQACSARASTEAAEIGASYLSYV